MMADRDLLINVRVQTGWPRGLRLSVKVKILEPGLAQSLSITVRVGLGTELVST